MAGNENDPYPAAGTSASGGVTPGSIGQVGLSAAQIRAWAGAGGTGDDPPVLRSPHLTGQQGRGRTIGQRNASGNRNQTRDFGPGQPRTSTLSEFNAEFFHRWEQTNFQQWLTSRMAATGEKSINTQSAYNYWIEAGALTAKHRGTKWTPEQYIEYMSNGGHAKTYDQVQADIANGSYALDADGNPITLESALNQTTTSTHRSTSYANMNPQAAAAAVNDIAKSTFGRMASSAEMKRFAKQVNSLLRANPTVTTSTSTTDPDGNTTSSSSTKDGMSATDATNVLEMKMERSSEGQAYSVGKMFEDAMRMM